jgi:hypothetical protein
MAIHYSPLQSDRKVVILALTAALHLGLFYCWLHARRLVPPQPQDRSPAIQWLWLKPPAPVERQRSVPKAETAPGPRAHTSAPAQASIAPTAPQAAPAVSNPAPAESAEDMLEQARRDVGRVYGQLKKERSKGFISAPQDTAQKRFERGMAEAADLAPNKWYEAPKTQEIIDPGGYGRKRYRVVGAGGTYCVTYESNHAPDGLDTMRNGIRPKITNCPPHEQPATKQEW